MRTRREILRAAAAAAGSLLAARLPTLLAAEPFKLAFIFVGPVTDIGWNAAHDAGRRALEREFGERIAITAVDNVPENADAERVLAQLASTQRMVVATSFGFMNPVLKVARRFPRTVFLNASGYKTAPNVGIYQARIYEGAYLLGVAAGMMSRSGTLGFIGAYPIPEVVRNINAFTLGARQVNPKAQTRVVWVDSWYDPPRERQAAEALIGLGADVLCQNTDSPAAITVAEEKGVYALGWDSDMSRFGPCAHLLGTTNHWDRYYIDSVRQVMNGSWKPARVREGLKEGMVVVTPINPRMPAAASRKIGEAREAIIQGRLLPFQGPLRDQRGQLRIAAGTSLDEDALMQIDWYVEGVLGNLPGRGA